MEHNNDRWKESEAKTNAEGEAVVYGTGELSVYNYDTSDKYAKPLEIYIPEKYNKSIDQRASVTTALPIYRFGDSMEWAAVTYNIIPSSGKSQISNKPVLIKFYTPHHILVDSITAAPDKWGRINGVFNIPDNGLSGNYIITVYDNTLKRQIGSTRVMVSDYKLPTFNVELTDTRIDYPSDEFITIEGKAVSYSGFPMSETSVNAELLIST